MDRYEKFPVDYTTILLYYAARDYMAERRAQESGRLEITVEEAVVLSSKIADDIEESIRMDTQPIDDHNEGDDHWTRKHTLWEDLFYVLMALQGLGRAIAESLMMYRVLHLTNQAILKLWKPKRTRR